jgi:hypothetical protein
MICLEPWYNNQQGYTETIKELFARQPRYKHRRAEETKSIRGALYYIKRARKGYMDESNPFLDRFKAKLKEIHMKRKGIKRIDKYNINNLINYSIDLLNAITFDEISVKKGILLTNLLDKTVKQIELLSMHNNNKDMLTDEGSNT